MGTPLSDRNAALIAEAARRVTKVDAYRTRADAEWVQGSPTTDRHSLYLRTAHGRGIALHLDEDDDLELSWRLDDVDAEVVVTFFRAMANAFPGQIRLQYHFDDAAIGASPSPPIARDRLIVAYPIDVVADCYPSVEVFAEAFERFEVVDDIFIGQRALGASDIPATLFAGNWHLARHAEEDLTDYLLVLDPQTDGEAAVAAAEPELLHWNGYSETERAHAYTAAIFGPHQHISAREVFHLRTCIRRASDGTHPVDHVRVLFPNRASAAQEARPLKDGGIEVLYLDDAGQYVPL